MKEIDRALLLMNIGEARTKITNVQTSFKKYCEGMGCESCNVTMERCSKVLSDLVALDRELGEIEELVAEQNTEEKPLGKVAKTLASQKLCERNLSAIDRQIRDMSKSQRMMCLESFKFQDGTDLIDCLPLFAAMKNGTIYRQGISLGVSGILMYNGCLLLKVHNDWFDTYTYSIDEYWKGEWALEPTGKAK